MKRQLFAVLAAATSIVAHAELPSGTVGSLLKEAENGNLPAIYSLTAGLRQVSIDSDHVMDAQINGRIFPAQLVAQLDPASSAFVIAMMYNRYLPETEAVFFYCKWAQRAFALHQVSTMTDAVAEMKWSIAKDTFEALVEPLTRVQRDDCDAQARNWRLRAD